MIGGTALIQRGSGTVVENWLELQLISERRRSLRTQIVL